MGPGTDLGAAGAGTMIDWTKGGASGSLRRYVRREVREHFRNNETMRKARYGRLYGTMRVFFSLSKFWRFLACYAAINFVMLASEAVLSAFASGILPTWSASGNGLDIKAMLLNISSYLITAQVGVLGVISLALALVTLIAQRDDAATDVKVYYHESMAFGVVASCIALLAVLCAQLFWPAQFLLHRSGLGTDLQIFKLILIGIHLLWLLINLAGLAHFISTTFDFVQRSARERLRERYTANVMVPIDMAARLLQQLYHLGGTDLGKRGQQDQPDIVFGMDYTRPSQVEIATKFTKEVALYDVRMVWVRWVLRRWLARCASAVAPEKRGSSPDCAIWFTLQLDRPLKGNVEWCLRRNGVPLTRTERVVLKASFRFRKVKNG